MDLFRGDSDTDANFTINVNYAKRYDKWRQGEEIQKLKDKYGDAMSSNSSSSEDEDEDGKEWTNDLEINFLKTLSSLKEKNPKIYDKNVKFFNEIATENNHENLKTKKNKNFVSIGQYQRDLLLKNENKFLDEKVVVEPHTIKTSSYTEEEIALKESFRNLVNETDSESDRDNETANNKWGTLFKKRIKTKQELKTEEDDYKLWLAGEKKNLTNKEEEKELKGIYDFWVNPNLDEGEQFLRDYILKNRFLECDNKCNIPAYDEIVHDSDSGLSADECTVEKQEEFERKYNFRFEEPDQEFIKRFPRTLSYSMRKKDERRKKHRETVKLRKQAEKNKKSEELKRLKTLKKKEIIERIQKLQEITGNEEIGFQSKDLEGDFNPDEHDKRMSELFDVNYYGKCVDVQKPECPELDEELEIENWDLWKGRTIEETELHCEDPGFNMDCDYKPDKADISPSELIKSSKKNKKRKRSKFAAAIAREKPLFDPKNKTFEKYVDEYYSLDYEDLIGDLPCKFKYRKVVPNNYGLSIEEILSAEDKELNSWVSIKKIMQRRPKNVELFDVQAYQKKAKNTYQKQKCLSSLYANEECETDSINAHQKRIKYNKIEVKNNNCNYVCHKNSQSQYKNTEKKNIKANVEALKKERKNKINNEDPIFNMSNERLMSYGLNPKKIKNKLKFRND